MKKFINILLFFVFAVLLQSCETSGKKKAVYKQPETLINTSDVITQGKKDLEKKAKEGPKPVKLEKKKELKRKTLTTEKARNYVSIPDQYKNLKQTISINFQGLDFKYVMSLMSDIGKINIIVGDEVSGTVNAKIDNIPWDVAFQTLLDMKTLGADIDAASGIIRIHTPEKLKGQETFKSERAESLKKKIELEESVEPILAQLFKLYYIDPAQAKSTLEDLFGISEGGSEGSSTTAISMSNLSITVEDTTRSIIVRGYKKDLDVVAAVVKEIDVRTKQVLIEAFIVEAGQDFEKKLGSKIRAMTEKGTSGEAGSTIITGTTGGAATTAGGIALGAAAGTVSNTGITGATSGIGIIKTFGTAALAIELEALQATGISNIVSSPSVFTLNNQEAKITQGTQIPYQTVTDGEVTTEFKEAALSLTVTPSIIGDGNVLLDIDVKKDSPDVSLGTDEPAIDSNQITTKLLVSDGDIVVIGGVKLKKSERKGTATPGASKVPVVGNLFKSKERTDELDEMLIFIAPKVVD